MLSLFFLAGNFSPLQQPHLLQSDRLPRPSLGRQLPFFAQVVEPLNEESVLMGVFTLKPPVHSRWGWILFILTPSNHLDQRSGEHKQ